MAIRGNLPARITLGVAGASLVAAGVALVLGLASKSTEAVCTPEGDAIGLVLGGLAFVAAAVAALSGIVTAIVRAKDHPTRTTSLAALALAVTAGIVAVVAMFASLDLCFTF